MWARILSPVPCQNKNAKITKTPAPQPPPPPPPNSPSATINITVVVYIIALIIGVPSLFAVVWWGLVAYRRISATIRRHHRRQGAEALQRWLKWQQQLLPQKEEEEQEEEAEKHSNGKNEPRNTRIESRSTAMLMVRLSLLSATRTALSLSN